MDQLLINAASGMKARMDSLDMLANNMANSGTAGFKTDREFYNLYEQSLPTVERQYTDFSQGQLLPTGNPLNAALNGKGFFALNSPSGTVYTRNGTFRVSTANQLETPEGYTLRNVLDNGKPINVDTKQAVDIAKDVRSRKVTDGSGSDRNRAAGIALRQPEEARQHLLRVDR